MHDQRETERLVDVLLVIVNSPHDKQFGDIAKPLDEPCPNWPTGSSIHFPQLSWSFCHITDQLDLSLLQQVLAQTEHMDHISATASDTKLNVRNQIFGICDPWYNANQVAHYLMHSVPGAISGMTLTPVDAFTENRCRLKGLDVQPNDLGNWWHL